MKMIFSKEAKINPRATDKTLTVPLSLRGMWQNALTNESVNLSGSLILGAYEYLILGSE